MKWAHYLTKDEFHNDPDKAKKLGAPAGFIFHIHDGEVTDPVELQRMSDQHIAQIQLVDEQADYSKYRIDLKTHQAVAWTQKEKDLYFPPPKKWAQYFPQRDDELPDGFIHAFNSQPITRPMDLAKMEAEGIHQMEVPHHIDHFTHKIEHGHKAHREYTHEEKKKHFPPAPLSLQDHLFISALKKGDIDINDVHDSVLEPLNKSLEHHHGAKAKLLKGGKTVKG